MIALGLCAFLLKNFFDGFVGRGGCKIKLPMGNMFQVFKEVNWSRYYFVILLGLMDRGEAAD